MTGDGARLEAASFNFRRSDSAATERAANCNPISPSYRKRAE